MGNKIIFTGGGSAGHVTVNLALIPHFIQEGWEVDYIGSENGIERQLVSHIENVHYHHISTGKLRRYLDWNNIKDPFKVMKGVFQAFKMIKKIRPNIIFSKGGFVSVPVIIGAWLNKVPIIIHESDITPGLANRISMPFATKVCTTFPETHNHLRSDKSVHVGAVVRSELRHGDATRGFEYCNLSDSKPVLLIMGGSLGSQRINQMIRTHLNVLLKDFHVVHICGKGQIDDDIDQQGYKQYEYISDELPDIMAMCDFVVSRAGSNSIFEFLALRKPMLLIPLSREASRGDQILNAQSFEKSGYGKVLLEEALSGEALINAIYEVYKNKSMYVENMILNKDEEATDKIIKLIKGTTKILDE